MQRSLFPRQYPSFYGGRLTKGRRKTLRPLARKRPLHLVLKSRRKDLFQYRDYLESEFRRLARRFQVRLYSIAVNHDHIHAAALFPGRKEYTAFIRALTGILARNLGRGLWQLLPFTRVLAWGKDFPQTHAYILKNREEAAGERPYEKRRNFYERWTRSLHRTS